MKQEWIDAFEAWLTDGVGYRPRTVVKLVSDLRTMLANAGVPPESVRAARVRDFAWVWDLWADFTAESKGRPPALGFERPALVQTGRKRKGGEGRALAAESIDGAEWRKLARAIERDPRIEARIIGVLMASGLRISDVLRAPPRVIAAALSTEDGIARIEVKGGRTIEIPVRGGSEEAWRQLVRATAAHHPKAPTFARIVVEDSHPEAGGAAYQRVRTVLLELGETVGITGRVHLHRLRRTVGVRLLEAGVPIEIVSKAFGHTSIRTTQTYTSESMARAVGEALRKINR